MTTSDRRFPLGLTIAAAIALAILLGLGTWQVRRLDEKRAEMAAVEAAARAEPIPIALALERAERGAKLDYVRVEATCPGLAQAPYVEIFSILEGEPGVRLVSACRLSGGRWRSVLVDRGFVAETISARPPVDARAGEPLTIRGVLRGPGRRSPFAAPPSQGKFYARELPPIAQALNADRPAPLFLMAETSTNPEWQALKPAPLPTAMSNRHLEYAITWYGLAAALAGVYAVMLWRRMKR